jgi:PAS domain-containing protein
MPAGVYTCDAEGRLTFFNQRAVELWGREPRLDDAQERFRGSFRMWTRDDVRMDRDDGPMAAAVREGRVTRNLEVVIEQPTGPRVAVTVNIDPLFGRDGRIVGAINVFSDVTDRSRQETAGRSMGTAHSR